MRSGFNAVLDSVLAALRESRIARTAVSAQRRKPLALAESAGVRLALVLLATAPVSKRERIAAIQAGVAGMSTEEAYYWYAKCSGTEAARGRRALRLAAGGGLVVASRPRVLIEEWLPMAELGIESRREAAPIPGQFPKLKTLHVWWARRPLAASAGAVLGSLMPAWSPELAADHSPMPLNSRT